jgi:four helix bundle protein
MGISKNILKYRAFKFSLDAIDFLEMLPRNYTRNYIFEIIGKQLLRAITSIGANIVEAQAGRTKKDFINFYHIALKSANESKYWLAILAEKLDGKSKEEVKKLLQEAIKRSLRERSAHNRNRQYAWSEFINHERKR